MEAIEIISVNCCGEVGDVIIRGVAAPPGKSVFEKAQFIKEDKKLWHFILNEPRGGVFKHVNLLVPSSDPKASIGFIIMEPEDIPPMSGSNAICVVTVLLEKGIIPITESEMKITLEAPGGLIQAVAECKNKKVESVKITNLPSFVVEFEKEIKVDNLGKLKVSTAFGGDSFVLVDNSELNIDISPENADSIVSICSKIVRATNEQLGFKHALIPNIKSVSFCMLMNEIYTNNDNIKCGRNTVCIRPRKLDRSPCGTGTSAWLAYLYMKDKISLKEKFISNSILNTEFECKLIEEKSFDGFKCVIPQIKGQAWITGEQKLLVNELNPFPLGYRLTDTWPKV